MHHLGSVHNICWNFWRSTLQSDGYYASSWLYPQSLLMFFEGLHYFQMAIMHHLGSIHNLCSYFWRSTLHSDGYFASSWLYPQSLLIFFEGPRCNRMATMHRLGSIHDLCNVSWISRSQVRLGRKCRLWICEIFGMVPIHVVACVCIVSWLCRSVNLTITIIMCSSSSK